MGAVIVVGGSGFYGQKVAGALRARGHTVTLGVRRPQGRAGGERVDLCDSASFASFSGFDLIVNCSDSVNAPPDAAVEYVLGRGGVWMETSAHLPTVERLLKLTERPDPLGTALVGVGVFPGLSTALVRALADEYADQDGGCARIELGIRLSPLSGAGPGNCALMVDSLFDRATRFEGGELVRAPTAAGPSAELVYDGQRARSVNFALPDTLLIRRCVAAQDVVVYFALVPGWLRFNFVALAWLCRLLRFARRPLAWALTWQMIALRAWLLRGVETRVQLLAIAERGTARERSRELSFDDGQQATAEGVVAAVEAWLARADAQRPVGVLGVAECFTLAELEGAAGSSVLPGS